MHTPGGLKRVSGIYRILNVINGKAYVGSSVDVHNRCRTHRNALNSGKHSNRLLQRAWNKYGPDAFVFRLIERVDDHASLAARETLHISAARAWDKSIGYNLAPVGGTVRGLKRSPLTAEQRAKISAAHKGRPGIKGVSPSAETRQKLRFANLGKKFGPRSPEACARISAGLVGRKVSNESRRKMSESAKRRPFPEISAEGREKQKASQRAAWADPVRKAQRILALKAGHKRRLERLEA